MFTGFDISTIQDAKFGSTQINEIWYGNMKLWPTTPPPHDYSQDYLTFEALEPTTFKFSGNDLQYSLNNGSTWTTLTVGYSTPQLSTGSKILWKQTGLRPTYLDGIGTFSATGNFKVYGNVMSLYYGDNFIGEDDLTGKDYAFAGLFSYVNGNNKLIDALNLILPATTLAEWCYWNMFYECTSLTTAPRILPATTLANNCYSCMFQYCTSLTTAPQLPATTLTDWCYEGMFQYCTSLTTAPQLPATRLKYCCYHDMFLGCTSLNYINCLATDISATYCTLDWVNGVSATGTFIRDTNMTAWTIGANGIPTNWTVVPPDYSLDYLTFEALQPTTFTFTRNALQYSLDNGSTWTTLAAGNSTPQLSIGDKILWKQTGLTPAQYNGIGTFSATGNFKAYGNVMSLYYGDNFIGQNDLTGKDYAFYALFNANTYLVNAENLILPATTLAISCYDGMYNNCTSLTTAPELPATTLANGCYTSMFEGCTALNYIKCLATNISASGCTNNWVQNVAASGTFIRDTNMTAWTIGANGIPTNWTVVPPLPHDYSRDYLTFEALQPTTFTFSANNLQYSLDNGSTWTTLTAGTATSQLSTGDKILWKQTGLTPSSSSPYGIGTFSATGNFKAYGNVMSLYYGDNFVGEDDLTGKDNAFRELFINNNYLIDVQNLILPATTLVESCYRSMFDKCYSLTSSPELPAITMAPNCYRSMFYGNAIVTAPILPATTLATQCYDLMFNGCTSLTTAPELPATTLANSCYYRMFRNCTALTTAPELPATNFATQCYYQMFYGCTSLNYIKCLATGSPLTNTSGWVNGVAASGTFVKAASMTSWTTGNNGIPSGWTIRNA